MNNPRLVSTLYRVYVPTSMCTKSKKSKKSIDLVIPHYSDHISTEGGHAEHVLVTRISNKMDDSSTDKQIFEFSKCPSPVEFRAAIYIVKCFRLKGIAEHVDHSTASL